MLYRIFAVMVAGFAIAGCGSGDESGLGRGDAAGGASADGTGGAGAGGSGSAGAGGSATGGHVAAGGSAGSPTASGGTTGTGGAAGTAGTGSGGAVVYPACSSPPIVGSSGCTMFVSRTKTLTAFKDGKICNLCTPFLPGDAECTVDKYLCVHSCDECTDLRCVAPGCLP